MVLILLAVYIIAESNSPGVNRHHLKHKEVEETCANHNSPAKAVARAWNGPDQNSSCVNCLNSGRNL